MQAATVDNRMLSENNPKMNYTGFGFYVLDL